MTATQRARKITRDVQINFRASKETKQLVDDLAQKHECSVADLMELALRALATPPKREGDA